MKGIDPWHEDWCVVCSHLRRLQPSLLLTA